MRRRGTSFRVKFSFLMSPWIRPRLMNGPFIIEHSMKFEFILPTTFSNEKVRYSSLPASCSSDVFLRTYFVLFIALHQIIHKEAHVLSVTLITLRKSFGISKFYCGDLSVTLGDLSFFERYTDI